MYSVVCRKSFESLKEVTKTVEEHRRGASLPIVLIGNKSDLAHMRQVTHEEGWLNKIFFYIPELRSEVQKVRKHFALILSK